MIYVNGDSWTWEGYGESKRDLWPTMIGEKFNLPVVNEGMGGGSNTRALYFLKNYFITQAPTNLSMIIIGLTTPYRTSLPNGEFATWNINGSDGGAHNESTGEKNIILQRCVTELQKPLTVMFEYYKNIWEFVFIAKQFKCQCYFFQMWSNDPYNLGLLNDEQNIHNFVSRFYKSSDVRYKKYINGFNFFAQESKKWNYYETPMSKLIEKHEYDHTNHPTISAHQKFSDFMYKIIKIKQDETL